MKFGTLEIVKAMMDWLKNKQNQRLGQYLVNHFKVDHSDIFYEEETEKAFNMFVEAFGGNNETLN